MIFLGIFLPTRYDFPSILYVLEPKILTYVDSIPRSDDIFRKESMGSRVNMSAATGQLLLLNLLTLVVLACLLPWSVRLVCLSVSSVCPSRLSTCKSSLLGCTPG